ncbi:uncharacterized protein LOC143026322 [Oratosquilla oratoria]|uniref:uncharacterized protein LOC143026322 n=1 Tax=Oratosquilla oratoria TaxID=337810 RepID=UPI003F765E1F
MAERVGMIRDEVQKIREHVENVKKEKLDIALRIQDTIRSVITQVGYCPMVAQLQQAWKQRESSVNRQISVMSQSVETCVAMQGIINHFRSSLLSAFDQHLVPPLNIQLSTACTFKGTNGEAQTNEMLELKEKILHSLEAARHQEEMCMEALCALLKKVDGASTNFVSTVSTVNQNLEKKMESLNGKIEEDLVQCSHMLNIMALMKQKVNSVFQNFSGI